MKIISVASIKGGVGKTTSVVRLAGFVAQHGIRTLLIDTDDQASLTTAFCDLSEVKDADSTYELMVGEDDAIVTPTTIIPNLDLFPASTRLKRLSEEDPVDVAMSLRDRIGALYADSYDLVLIDTPGSSSTVLNAALGAAHHVYAPIELAEASIFAFEKVMQSINRMRKSINPSLSFEGFLPNRIRSTRVNAQGRKEPVITRQREVLEALKEIGGPESILGMWAELESIVLENGLSVKKSGRVSTGGDKQVEEFARTLLGRAGFILDTVTEASA